MSGFSPSIEEIIALAERLLSKRFGGEQRLEPVAELGGSGPALVIRAKLAPSGFLPDRTVVVKYVPITDDELDDAAMVREVVAYQFTTSLGEEARPGPVLLAHDFDHRVLVITDIGDGDTLEELLERADAERRIALMRELGQALGRMHAATVDREQDFETLRLHMARRHPEAAAVNAVRASAHGFSIQRGLELLAEAGLPAPDEVAALAEEAGRMMRGGNRAFTPFDLSPDNIVVAERAQFLDYEWAGFRDWLIDVASVVAGFPQAVAVSPISEAEAEAFIEAWSWEVDGLHGPERPGEDRFWQRLATALLGVTLSTVSALHYGTPHNVVAAAARAVGAEDLRTDEEFLHPIGAVLRGEPGEEATDVARSELYRRRRDLRECVDALARYARRTTNPRFAAVADYAAEVLAVLAPPAE